MKCIHCKKCAGERYRINQHGDVFCSDECYQEDAKVSDRSVNDTGHPYFKTYEYVRGEYLSRLHNRKSDSESKKESKEKPSTTELEELIDDHMGFCVTAEDDGVFALEICLYVKRIQEEILEHFPENGEIGGCVTFRKTGQI